MKKLINLAVCFLIFSIGYAQKKVEHTDFLIVENPKKKYEGFYKNGKPFSGYFKAEEYTDRAPFIDYYENGDRKFRYHFDYLKGETYHGRYYYDTKTEYKDGKIKNGFDIKNKGRALFLAEYKDFKRTKIHLDVFAMHYFNRITFAMQDNILKISEYESKDWRLEVKKEKNQPYEIMVYHKDKIFYQNKSKKPQEVNEALAEIQTKQAAFAQLRETYESALASQKEKATATSLRKPLLDLINKTLIPYLIGMTIAQPELFKEFVAKASEIVNSTNEAVKARLKKG